MFSSNSNSDSPQGAVMAWLAVLLVLVIGLVLGVGISQSRPATSNGQPAPAARASFDAPVLPAAPQQAGLNLDLNAAAPSAAEQLLAASDAASVQVESAVVKFYFESGKADLPPGSLEAMAELIDNVRRQGGLLRVVGFHDAQGSPVLNAELALRRARAVHTTLQRAGLTDRQIAIAKPAPMEGSASEAEARRVEVSWAR